MKACMNLKKINKPGIIFSFFFLYSIFLNTHAQEEVLSGITIHKEIRQNVKKEFQKSIKAEVPATLIELPVIDDFSSNSLFPDTSFWWNSNSVFINNHFAIDPPSLGTATFDAMNDSGSIYNIPLNRTERGDALTSRPLKMEGAKDIYLSFVYQAGGMGEIPKKSDSLTLQFFDVDSSEWVSVWKAINHFEDSLILEVYGNDSITWKPLPDTFIIVTNGDTIKKAERVESISQFKNVILPVNTSFADDGFQFRFMNYINIKDADYEGSIGNSSMWHLDYVYLDENRDINDTLINDIAMVNTIDTIFKNYVTIPARHLGTELGFNQRVAIPKVYVKNNYDAIINFDRGWIVKDEIKNKTETAGSSSGNIPPFQLAGIKDQLSGEQFDINDYVIEGGIDSAKFTYTYHITAEDDLNDRKQNDTMSYTFDMFGYYAYDDGTAEKGYGISGVGTRNAEVAVRFDPLTADSLHGVFIYFNKPYDAENFTLYFNLTIWNMIDNLPGDTLYSREAKVGFMKGPYEYTYYRLEEPVYISKSFFVGWVQFKEEFMNVGFDRYYNNRQRNFVNFGSGWVGSKFDGTIMIRPNFSDIPVPVTINKVENKLNLTTYPNPVTSNLYINIHDYSGEIKFGIADLQGRIVKRGIAENQTINCSDLKKGIYLFTFEINGILNHKKIIVAGQ